VSVIVDFSGSFVSSPGRRGAGLLIEDHRALDAIAEAVSEVATKHWHPPLKIVWTKITGSARLAEPICAPLETDSRLVKPAGAIGTRREIEAALKDCVVRVVAASRDFRNLGSYTDISGAIAAAAEMAMGSYSERVLIIFSDFHEDLPAGSRAANFRLHGERVVMIHRPGSDEKEKVAGYLRRLEKWKALLKERGAADVAVLPVFAVSTSRVRTALRPQDEPPGTAITMLADLKRTALSAHVESLLGMSRAVAELSEEWPPPVIAQWTAVSPTGFLSQAMPVVEFGPTLIKRPNALNTAKEFSTALEELSKGVLVLGRMEPAGDLSGSIALAASIDPPPKKTILLVLSDFDYHPGRLSPSFALPPATKVVMLHVPAVRDGPDPDAYPARRLEWEKRFVTANAEVCQIQLATLTRINLNSCFSTHSRMKRGNH
jgi:hypothetical protein